MKCNLPNEIIYQILTYVENEKELLDYRLLNKHQNKLISKYIFNDPDYKLLKMDLTQFNILIQKYGALVNNITISEGLGYRHLDLVYKYCFNITKVFFYGSSKKYMEFNWSLTHLKHLNKVEVFLLDDLSNRQDLLILKQFHLKQLVLHYDDIFSINPLLPYFSNLNKLSLYQLNQVNVELFYNINTSLLSLKELTLQAIKIDNDAIYYFNTKFNLKLNKFELEIELFQKEQAKLLIDQPNLKVLNINLNYYKAKNELLTIYGEYPNLTQLSLNNLNTNDVSLFNKFNNLTSLTLDSYLPITEKIFHYLVFDMNTLVHLQLNKCSINESYFNIPKVINKESNLKQFIITKNEYSFSINYICFILNHLTHLKEWILPQIDNVHEEEIDNFVKSLVEFDVNFSNSIHTLYGDLTLTTIPLFHYFIQSLTNLKYLYLNIMDDDLELSQLSKEFNNINKDNRITIKFN
ncbi:hypothetical protein K502DRAFT_351372 [Neoconidiobolus thromboides FSU 785]|nr:hypothetical protein K502DRAFT_351372 [Neoconidiobolus thromboides FSU 785]